MVITAFNPDTTELEKTYLSSYTAKGATDLAVKNSDRFVDENPILIGEMGDEHSEIRIIDSIDSDKLELTIDTATDFDHDADDPVFQLQYDKVVFYRKDGVDGTPVAVQTVPIDVDNEKSETLWDDPDTLSTHYYQTSYVNSVTGDESDLSDAVPATGYAITRAGNIIDQVVRRVRDTNFHVLTVDEYLDAMNEVGSDLITQAQKPYRFLRRIIELDTVQDQAYIDFPAQFWKFFKVYVKTTAGNYYRWDEMFPLNSDQFSNRYDNSQGLPMDGITDVGIDEDNNRLLIYPTPKTSQTAVVRLKYYKTFDNIDDMGSPIETPNNLIYIYKLRWEFYMAKAESDPSWRLLADKFESKYGNEIVKMQRYNRLDIGTPRSFRSPRAYRRRRFRL